MPPAYLNAGATSLAAANWSDATGFADSAELYVQAGTQTITGGLSPSLANGIQNFDVLSGFSGNIGGAAGSLAVETRSSLLSQTTQIPRIRYYASGGSLYYTPQGAGAASDVCDYYQIGGAAGSLAVETRSSLLNQATQIPRIRYYASGGSLYYTPQGAGAATDLCDYYQIGGSGNGYITGTGTIKRVESLGGRLYLAPTIGSVANFRWVLSGGSVTIDGVSGSTKIHALTIAGGQHLLKKGIQGTSITATGFTEGLNVSGGSVTIDAYGETFSDLRIYGGYVTVVNSGAIAVTSGYVGTLDFSKLQRPLTLTLLEDAPGLTVIPSKMLTITTRNPIGTGAIGLT